MAEVLVLGAGMVGVSTGLALQARGHDVTIIERGVPGRGTSYGNAGLIQTEAVEPYAMPLSPGALFEPETRTPGLWEASTLAVTQGITVIRVNLAGTVAMVAGQRSACNLSSPVGMAGAVAAAAEVGFDRFIQPVAVFSLAIGLLNLFPIPVLDGGHLVFHVYEGLTGKPPSDRVMQVLMTAGMALLIGVMLFALSNDLYRC